MFSYSTSSVSGMPEDTLLEQFPQQCCQVAATPPTPTAAAESEGEVVDELLLILVESLEEVSTKSREFLLRKFFYELEKERALEGFIRERLKHSKVRAISESFEFPASSGNGKANSDGMNVPTFSTQRGVEVDSTSIRNFNAPVKELSHKLERFKIRTPNLDVAVEDEQKGDSETRTS